MSTQSDLDAKQLREAQLVARGDACQMFAALLTLPSQQLVAALIDGSLLDGLEEVAAALELPKTTLVEPSRLLANYQGSGNPELLRELRVDYTQLFTQSPRPAVGIYECLVLGDEHPLLFVNQAALDCERLYQRAGLELGSKARDSADNLCTQLKFLGVLYARAQEQLALDGADGVGGVGDTGLSETCDLIEEFTRSHLAQWAAPFFAEVGAKAQTDVYRAIGRAGLAIFSKDERG
jgi:TorA maturation chaperone TorD